ncbi:hypothetical protein T310_7324 [Rasamsonia emersonii CBS 393.64]|uniref:Uncharacterized protein n=1 Tax=Rasamsonia emersonii (strain ATCC 16479 / CBS 393.64 / IMI 116815) TaxID=1408163 RepID=A0A0F4YLK2_RASE3|nr:hypothetical protein T310_7324 [Rasamsonia emersonii CBS 393.64]KKA18726.1 hypothetical protein T310_7324 [Rasamsonia emersonii CBS 393.64]
MQTTYNPHLGQVGRISLYLALLVFIGLVNQLHLLVYCMYDVFYIQESKPGERKKKKKSLSSSKSKQEVQTGLSPVYIKERVGQGPYYKYRPPYC